MLSALAMTDRTAFAIGAVIYGAAFLFGLLMIRLRKSYSRAAMFALLTGGFLLQTLGMNLRGAEIKACPLGNTFEIAQFIAWSLVLSFYHRPVFKLRLLGFLRRASRRCYLEGLSGSTWDSPTHRYLRDNHWIELHAALAIFGYGVFAILALVSAMFLIQQHGLKTKQFGGSTYSTSVQQLIMAKRLLLRPHRPHRSPCLRCCLWIEIRPRPIFKLGTTCLIWLGYGIVVVLGPKEARHSAPCDGVDHPIPFGHSFALASPIRPRRVAEAASKRNR